jgi:lysophospholipase L1-like esterase
MVDVAHVGSSVTGTALTSYTPDNAAFNYSDYCAVAVSAAMARFTRPTVDGQGFEFTNPGARVRFKTNAQTVVVRLQYNNLVTRLDTYNAVGLALVDGVLNQTFTRAQGAAGPLAFQILFGSAVARTIEVVMPYCAGVDFTGIDITTGATLQAPAARPATRYVAVGDSITQGFLASDVGHSWPYGVIVADSYQVINHGYGGRICVAADGTTAANLSPTMASYLIGYNDFVAQTPLATFKANFKSFINNFRAIAPSVKLYCITPIYSPNTNTLTLANYRTQIVNALSELANALNVLVNGLSIMTNSNDRLADTIHPNDLGASEIVTNLTGVIVP